MNNLYCYILAGGKGTRLKSLTKNESKPMLKIGSSTLIDFTLNNCVSANVKNIGVIVQYAPLSLIEHLYSWRNIFNKNLKILPPSTSFDQDDSNYYGTAQSVLMNRDVALESDCEHVLVLPSDHIYVLDYKKLYEKHIKSGVNLTVGTYEVPIEDASRYGVFDIDENGFILNFEEKPKHPTSNTVSMGIYIFNKKFLFDILKKLIKKYKDLDFGKHVIPYCVENYNISTFTFNGYWMDVGTIEAFWKASMDYIDNISDINHFNMLHVDNKILPKISVIKSSSVCDLVQGIGNHVEGNVTHSILGNNIIIEKDVNVINSVISDSCTIKEGVTVKNAIISKNTVVNKDVIGSENEISHI